MEVKAKFRCTSVTNHDGGTETCSFVPVSGGSDENKQWSKYTPSGRLEMSITADGAQGQFKPGREYYLTIVEA